MSSMSEHYAVEAVVILKRADNFKAEAVTIKSDHLRQIVGRARNANMRLIDVAHHPYKLFSLIWDLAINFKTPKQIKCEFSAVLYASTADATRSETTVGSTRTGKFTELAMKHR